MAFLKDRRERKHDRGGGGGGIRGGGGGMRGGGIRGGDGGIRLGQSAGNTQHGFIINRWETNLFLVSGLFHHLIPVFPPLLS